MTCADCTQSLGAYVDGELPPDEATEMEKHIRSCADCSAAHSALIAISSRLKGSLMRYDAPDVLKARIRASLASAEDLTASPRVGLTSRWNRTRWTSLVAAAVAVAVVSSASTIAVMNRRGDDSVANEVLASHVRSLMPGHLTDVASNDQHNVKPWFNGRVDVSPDVPRLDSLGYPLLGGRVDYIAGRRVATVVYGRRQHIINVFSWPAPNAGGDVEPGASRANGYNVVKSRHNGLEVWTVSDLNLAELRDFIRMMSSTR